MSASEQEAVCRVVIIGAGFGGLEAALRLGSAPVDLTVVDRHNYHLFQPLLYQVATAALSPADIAVPIRHILRDQKNTTMLLDEVVGVDPARGVVRLRTAGALPFDRLILATGSVYSYFGHDDWPRLAPGLKSLDDATWIRRRLLLAFEHAESCAAAAARQRLLTFVIIGAGPTGVEMAGALAELARAALAQDFRRINPRAARIILVEAGPQVLAGFPDKFVRFAERELTAMGVELRLNAPITVVDAEGVVADGERIASATVLWCAGVQATPVASWLGVEPAKGGRVAVTAELRVPGHPNIFVIGDAAFLTDAEGKPLPGVAPVAKQQGRYVADLIRAQIAGAPAPAPFRYRDQGALATIGRSAAVADLPHLKLTGWPGWVLWSIVHIYFLIGFRNRVSVFLSWIWAWLTYARGARLITGDDRR
ncbi:MAG TPA: NAD(P)/FAD-dependent oxidoreductase [Stellaceae bacterium]|nr:NAD(P)/FAD-dependent oxidoreductase [Stellaceae bacterium]